MRGGDYVMGMMVVAESRKERLEDVGYALGMVLQNLFRYDFLDDEEFCKITDVMYSIPLI